MVHWSSWHACYLQGLLAYEDCALPQLLIRQWDKRLSRDILAHWLDLLSEDGWIAREQVSTTLCTAAASRPLPLQGMFCSTAAPRTCSAVCV